MITHRGLIRVIPNWFLPVPRWQIENAQDAIVMPPGMVAVEMVPQPKSSGLIHLPQGKNLEHAFFHHTEKLGFNQPTTGTVVAVGDELSTLVTQDEFYEVQNLAFKHHSLAPGFFAPPISNEEAFFTTPWIDTKLAQIPPIDLAPGDKVVIDYSFGDVFKHVQFGNYQLGAEQQLRLIGRATSLLPNGATPSVFFVSTDVAIPLKIINTQQTSIEDFAPTGRNIIVKATYVPDGIIINTDAMKRKLPIVEVVAQSPYIAAKGFDWGNVGAKVIINPGAFRLIEGIGDDETKFYVGSFDAIKGELT